jgi:very-short-patch-repair endonuclease
MSMRWVTNKEQSQYMKKRRNQNKARSLLNRNENNAAEIFTEADGWKRQAQWGARIFDFWNHEKGVAVEIDGPEHNHEYDRARDQYNFLRSGIIVVRVSNGNYGHMEAVAKGVKSSGSWSARREAMGLNAKGKKAKRHLLQQAGVKPAHGNWGP